MIINLGEEAASDTILTLKEGPLTETYQATQIYGGEAELPNLVANDNGGFEAYQLSAEISGSGIIMIELQPVQ